MQNIAHDRLKELLRYDQATGYFFWRSNRGNAKKGARAGSLNPSGKKSGGVTYWSISVCGRKYIASRIAYFYMTGRWPENQMDHKDKNSLNDSWGNLRPATQSQNEANKAAYKNNSTGIKGIWPLRNGSYAARIYRDRKSIWLGVHKTPELAQAAYATAARAHDGQFARLG